MRIDFNTEAKARGFAADMERLGDSPVVTEENGTWFVSISDEDDNTAEREFARIF